VSVVTRAVRWLTPVEVVKAERELERPIGPTSASAGDLSAALARIEKRHGPASPGETLTEYLARVERQPRPGETPGQWEARISKALEERHREHERRFGHLQKSEAKTTMDTNLEAQRASEKLDSYAVEIRKADGSLSAAGAYIRALKEHPDLYALVRDYHPPEPVKKAAAGLPVLEVPLRLQRAADEIRKSDTALTPEQALLRAMREQPDLVERS
jgi:hypothetical protein